MVVRPEEPRDRRAIHAVEAAAFPSPAAAELVDALRQAGTTPLVSLVADDVGDVVGHILFSPVTLDGHARLMGLGPMAVAPARQRRGIGSILVREGLAAWVATGSEMISYAGLQIAFAFFYSVFQGYAPDTDLDNVRNRVVGILFGLIVTGLVFAYIWPEHTIDRFRYALRAALQQLAKLLELPRPDVSIEKTEADALIAQTSRSFEQARRYADLTVFESEELRAADRPTNTKLENILVRAEEIFASAKSLVRGDAQQNQSRTALLSETAAELQRLD